MKMIKYEYCAPDPKHYAADLRLDSHGGVLQWVSGRGQDAFMLRTPYGEDGRNIIESLCAELSEIDLKPGKFTELRDKKYAVRYVTALERVRENGCAIDGAARSYTVFACVTDDFTRRIYAHRGRSISSPCRHVPMRVAHLVEPVTETRGFFRKIKIYTGYYKIIFSGKCDSNYADGDIIYQADGLEIPVTRRLIEAGEAYVYIKNQDMKDMKMKDIKKMKKLNNIDINSMNNGPVFVARKDGIELI